ncbi:MAG: Ig-like domain-containing protein [Prevotella sp.]|nr:Ig-like domain-containing protein [Prevotella sp.]
MKRYVFTVVGIMMSLTLSAQSGKSSGAPANVEAVDLGLPSGTRWASCNVGATKPEEYGGYYSWGETEEKDNYSWEKYKYLDVYEKYDGYTRIICKDIGNNICGTQYDVAHVKWGGNWRMPTKAEMEELLEQCTTEQTVLNKVQVMKLTGPNGNFIFLPFTGFYDDGDIENEGFCTQCWSGELDSYSSTWALVIYNEENYKWVGRYGRNEGNSVRPVMDAPSVSREAIDLGLPSGTKWANMNVGASRPEEYGTYFAWGETSAKSSYSWDNYMCPEMACGKPGDPVFDFVGDIADIAGTKFDAAKMNWGASWNMPTAKQVEELASNCYSSLVTINGVQCRKLTSRINGNEIIFPLAGARWFEDFAYEGSLCYYWASTLRQGGYVSPGRLIVRDDVHGWGWSMGGENDRFCGFPIRPVMRTTVADPNLTLGTKVLMLTEGESVALTYTYEPSDADISALTWTTSDSSIATVDREGVVTAVSEGSCTITVSCGSLGQQECRVIVNNVTGTSSGHEYVDLGLPSGTLWATTNVGAETPNETGNLLSWVESQGDAASASWGAYWRLPMREQLEELLAGTSLVYTSLNGTEGFLLTSLTNGKCIFLPVTNSTGLPLRGCFWSGTSDGGSTAYALNITSAAGDVLSFNASEHLAVRLVYDESVGEGSTFTVKAGDLDFGSVAVGNRRSMSFDIHNNTFGVIKVQPFGIDADDFFVDWTGGEIQPNATQSVTVTYSPTKESVAAGGSLLIATATDSSFVNVAATSHKGSDELTTKANLVVWCKNGAKVTFLLNDKPIVTIKDGKWKIDGKNASAEYDVADVVKMTYDGIPDDIPAIEVGSENPFALDAEALTFYSDSEDLHVRIVASSGIIVRQFVAHRGTSSSVPLSQFAPGVYIVNVNNISYKISIK